MKPRGFLALLGVAALQACGGGADAPSTPIAGCKAVAVSIAVLGDSTAAGIDGGTGQLVAMTPAMRLQHDLDARFGAGATVVTDYAISGTTAAQAPRVVADIVTGNFGLTEARLHVPIATYTANMQALGLTLVVDPFPVSTPLFDATAYIAAAKALPGAHADVTSFVLARPQWQAEEPDQVHPDQMLYLDVVDGVIFPAVAAQVAPLRCVKAST
jgi:hypothetical protein